MGDAEELRPTAFRMEAESPMTKERPLGIRVIAMILLLNGAILISFTLAFYVFPEQTFKQLQSLVRGIPYFRNLPLDSDPWTIVSDFALGAWAVLKGIGIWRMWSWVRILIIIDLLGRAGDLLFFGAFSNQATLLHLLSNPDISINLAVNFLVLLYLLDPRVKEAFEERNA
jgi:hypothetical protein